ncbi:MAG TPA: hypothetical protein VHV31_10610 [Nitrolancea sp.]|jgi:hypothetical protein|nr:hypothetical protein [Nitrolancea sp.]
MMRLLGRVRYALACVLLLAIIGAIGWSFAAANIVAPSMASDTKIPIDTSQFLQLSIATPTGDSTSDDTAIQASITLNSPLGTPSGALDQNTTVPACTPGGIPMLAKKKPSICQMLIPPPHGLP